MDTDIPLFFSEIQYLLLEAIPLENIMRVLQQILKHKMLQFYMKQLYLFFEGKML